MILVDLDGTLIKVNTFRYWVKFITLQALFCRQFSLLLRVLYFSFQRKILGGSHQQYKANLCRLNIPQQWVEIFSSDMLEFVNHRLVSELMDKKFIVVTSAPAMYAAVLVNRIFGRAVDTIAADWNEQGFDGNYGESKLTNVLTCYNEKIIRVYTDSIDDLPIMKAADEVVLVTGYKPLKLSEFNGINIVHIFD